MKFLIGFVDLSFVAAYFILADHLGPKLASTGKLWLWWTILFGLVIGSYLFTRWIPRVTRTQKARTETFTTIAYGLLLITLFLYDFSLRLLLDRHGLGHVWIVGLLLTLGAVVLVIWKSQDGQKQDSQRSS